MDEKYLLVCTRYIELNSVRAGLVKNLEDWPWSSASSHIKEENDVLVNVSPLLLIVRKGWSAFLSKYPREADMKVFQKHERTGRPLGEEQFIEKLETLLNRSLKLQKAGRKKKK